MSIPKDILAKWAAGKLSREQQQSLSEHYDLDALQAWLDRQAGLEVETVSEDSLWKGIQEKKKELRTDKKDSPPESKNPSTNISSRKPEWLKWIVFLLPLIFLIAYFMFRSQIAMTTIKTEKAEVKTHLFADGTTIDLAPQTEIRFNENQWETERLVVLEGQATFNVAKGNPFIVQTRSGDVEVLGTQFDIWSINRDWMRVQCYEGKVSVSDPQSDHIILEAAEEVSIANGKIGGVQKMTNNKVDWKAQYRSFTTTPIKLVLLDLERFFDIRFVASGLEDEVFTGVITLENVEQAARYLSTTMAYEFKQKENTIYFTSSK